jgi:putative glutamine amidotransferase
MKDSLLIGVSARIYQPQSPLREVGGIWTRTLHYLEQSVAHWVMSGGAMPVMIPEVERDSLVQRSEVRLDWYAHQLDGLVLQGGNDVAPESYGEAPQRPEWAGDRVRDRYEMELIQAFVDAGKPVFGICRGLQVLNVLFGGTLYQDITLQRPGARCHVDRAAYDRLHHAVDIEPGSTLARLYPGQPRIRVNSIHHQAIRDLAPGFTIEARSPDDGLIEAIRRTDGSYVAAVQWHPEFHHHGRSDGLFDDAALLQDFLTAARAAAPR